MKQYQKRRIQISIKNISNGYLIINYYNESGKFIDQIIIY